jgi:hypothetical protein
MSINKTTASIAKTIKTATTQHIPKSTVQKTDFFSGLFQSKKVESLEQPQQQAIDAPNAEPQKVVDPTTAIRVQNLLKDTSRSTLDKLKGLLPIPASLTPIIDMFLGKKTKTGVKVSVENNSLNLTAGLDMPGQGIKGSAVLSLPMTAQEAKESVTELHPALVGHLSNVLNPLVSDEQQVQALIKLISTLPSETIQFIWSNGSADIVITLPNGAILKLNLTLPTSEESANTPDALRTFLKSILKENYAGIETLLNKDMIFTWNGSTSRFEIGFPQQLALNIKDISIDISNPILEKLISAVGNNSTVILPKNIRGTIDFKNPSIQFDKGTTFIVNNAPVPDITINKISYDPTTEKLSLSLKTSWFLIPDALLEDIEIDLKEDSSKQKDVTKPSIVKFECVPIDTNKNDAVAEIKVSAVKKETVSVFESLKKMVKVPEALEPLLGIFLADQTKLDVNVGIEDNLTVSVNNLNIPKLGLVGKASLSIPTQVQAEAETMPVDLHPQLMKELNKLLAKEFQMGSLEETTLFTNIIDLVLRMPNQNIHIHWEGGLGIAQLNITLPGGMVLNLELDVQKIQGKNDPLMAKFLEVFELEVPKGESPLYYHHTKLLEVLKTVAADDPRRAQIQEVLRNHADNMDTLLAELAKVIERDILRTKLTEILGSQFAADFEPLLSQPFTFNWDGKTKEFTFKFLEQQTLAIKSVKLKKGGFFQNMLRKFVSWITKNRVITLPKEIHGKVNFETASVEFKKGTSFTIKTALGISKKLGLRMFSFARKNMIDVGFRCFGSQEVEFDTTKSEVESARIAILENAPINVQNRE